MARRVPLTPAYRLEVTARALAAVLGAFVLTSAACLLLALALWKGGVMARADAVNAATMLSWALWTGLAMWAFHAARLSRVWLGLLVASALVAALCWPLLSIPT